MSLIRKAIFPVGGMGTRLLPATKAIPKEMLTVIDKPLIQYAVEEAIKSDITDLIFISGRNKVIIEDHFDSSPELENYLLNKNKHEILKSIKSILPSKANCIYLRQSGPLGLGHAILTAESVIGKEPFAVILPDDLIDSSIPVIRDLISIYEKYSMSVVCIETIKMANSIRYGMVSIKEINQYLSRLDNVIEKPLPEDSPSNLAIVGRYVFDAKIFNFLKRIKPGVNDEIQLTDGIALMIRENSLLAYKHNGKRYDCGNKHGLFRAIIEIGKKYHNLHYDTFN